MCHVIPSDIQDELKHEILLSKVNISVWKADCVYLRTIHQEQARQAIITHLIPQQALLIMYWAMKSVVTIDNQQERRMATKISFISQCNNLQFTIDDTLQMLF